MRNKQEELLSLVICSFDGNSDLWEPHFKMLSKNWSDRNILTYLITDKQTDIKFENVEIFVCDEYLDFSGRLKVALEKINTKYVLLILDDYFLNEKIDNYKILKNVLFMNENNVSYLRMYPIPFRNPFKIINNKIDMVPINHPYAINLYPAIWDRLDLLSSIQSDVTAWEFEISLTPYFRKNNFSAFYSNGKEFPFMNSVVKGKFFNKPYTFLIENNLYNGGRFVLSKKEEFIFRSKRVTSIILPRFLLTPFKKFLKYFGFEFYS